MIPFIAKLIPGYVGPLVDKQYIGGLVNFDSLKIDLPDFSDDLTVLVGTHNASVIVVNGSGIETLQIESSGAQTITNNFPDNPTEGVINFTVTITAGNVTAWGSRTEIDFFLNVEGTDGVTSYRAKYTASETTETTDSSGPTTEAFSFVNLERQVSRPTQESGKVKIFAEGSFDADTEMAIDGQSSPPTDLTSNGKTFTIPEGTIASNGMDQRTGYWDGNRLQWTENEAYIYGSGGNGDLSGDFTIDVIVYPGQLPVTAYTVCGLSQVEGSNANVVLIELVNTHIVRAVVHLTGEATLTLEGGLYDPNRWSVIALEREGDVWSLYVDGEQVTTTTAAKTVPSNMTHVRIGRDFVQANKAPQSFEVQAMRVSSTARYSGQHIALPSSMWGIPSAKALDERGVAHPLESRVVRDPLVIGFPKTPSSSRQVIKKNNANSPYAFSWQEMMPDIRDAVYVSVEGSGSNDGRSLDLPAHNLTSAHSIVNGLTTTNKRLILCLDTSDFSGSGNDQALSSPHSNTNIWMPQARYNGSLNVSSASHNSYVFRKHDGQLVIGRDNYYRAEEKTGSVVIEIGTHEKTVIEIDRWTSGGLSFSGVGNGAGTVELNIRSVPPGFTMPSVPSGIKIIGRLGNISLAADDDAFHKTQANEIEQLTVMVTPHDSDAFLVEDSQSTPTAFAKTRMHWSAIRIALGFSGPDNNLERQKVDTLTLPPLSTNFVNNDGSLDLRSTNGQGWKNRRGYIVRRTLASIATYSVNLPALADTVVGDFIQFYNGGVGRMSFYPDGAEKVYFKVSEFTATNRYELSGAGASAIVMVVEDSTRNKHWQILDENGNQLANGVAGGQAEGTNGANWYQDEMVIAADMGVEIRDRAGVTTQNVSDHVTASIQNTNEIRYVVDDAASLVALLKEVHNITALPDVVVTTSGADSADAESWLLTNFWAFQADLGGAAFSRTIEDTRDAVHMEITQVQDTGNALRFTVQNAATITASGIDNLSAVNISGLTNTPDQSSNLAVLSVDIPNAQFSVQYAGSSAANNEGDGSSVIGSARARIHWRLKTAGSQTAPFDLTLEYDLDNTHPGVGYPLHAELVSDTDQHSWINQEFQDLGMIPSGLGVSGDVTAEGHSLVDVHERTSYLNNEVVVDDTDFIVGVDQTRLEITPIGGLNQIYLPTAALVGLAVGESRIYAVTRRSFAPTDMNDLVYVGQGTPSNVIPLDNGMTGVPIAPYQTLEFLVWRNANTSGCQLITPIKKTITSSKLNAILWNNAVSSGNLEWIDTFIITDYEEDPGHTLFSVGSGTPYQVTLNANGHLRVQHQLVVKYTGNTVANEHTRFSGQIRINNTVRASVVATIPAIQNAEVPITLSYEYAASSGEILHVPVELSGFATGATVANFEILNHVWSLAWDNV